MPKLRNSGNLKVRGIRYINGELVIEGSYYNGEKVIQHQEILLLNASFYNYILIIIKFDTSSQVKSLILSWIY